MHTISRLHNFVASTTAVASEVNAEFNQIIAFLNNDVVHIESATTYVPQVDQGVTTNIAKTVNVAEYVQVNKIIHLWVDMLISGSGTAGSIVTVTLPVTSAVTAFSMNIGSGMIFDVSTAIRYICAVEQPLGTKVHFPTDVSSNSAFGNNPSVALASGDVIRFAVTYRKA